MENLTDYDQQTTEMLSEIGQVFERYNRHVRSEQFMSPEEIQSMSREVTAHVCLLNVRLGQYSSGKMYSHHHKKTLIRKEKNRLYSIKQESKLTESMIATMSESTHEYILAEEDNLNQTDFTTRLELIIKAANTLWESLKSETIQANIERKQSQLDV